MAGKLNDTRIRALKPTGKIQKIADGGGLYMHISAAGGKLWRMAYSFEGKQKVLAFGKYPEISLQAARRLAMEAKERLAEGIDPGAEKQAQKRAAIKELDRQTRTFQAVADEWLATKRSEYSAATLKKKLGYLSLLNRHLANIPIDELTAPIVLEPIKLKENLDHRDGAHKMLEIARQVCAYSVAMGYVQYNAAAGLSSILKPIKTNHFSALTDPAEFGKFLVALDTYSGHLSTMYALRIIIYAPLRSTELRGASWGEIDFEKAIWTIPATRYENPVDGGGMKMRQAFQMPLSRQAQALFSELKEYRQPGDLCFPGRANKNKAVTGETLGKAVKALGYGGRMTIHGIRSVFMSFCNEKKFDWNIDGAVIDAALAHSEKDKVRAAYLRTNYLEQRQRLMQLWANYVDELRASSTAG